MSPPCTRTADLAAAAPGSPEALDPAPPAADSVTPPGSPEAHYAGSPVYTADDWNYPWRRGFYPGSPSATAPSDDEASDPWTSPGRDDGPPTPTHGPGTPDYGGVDPSPTLDPPETNADPIAPEAIAPEAIAVVRAEAIAVDPAEATAADPIAPEAIAVDSAEATAVGPPETVDSAEATAADPIAATPCGCPTFAGDCIRKAYERFDDCSVCREDKKLSASDWICPGCFNATCSECRGEMDKLVDEWGDPRPWRCPHCRSYKEPLLLGAASANDFCKTLFKNDEQAQFSGWIRSAMDEIEADAGSAGYSADILAKKCPEHWFSNPPAHLRHLDEVPAVTSPEYTQFAASMFARWVIMQTYSAAQSKVIEHQKRLADKLEDAEELRVTADAKERNYREVAETLAVTTAAFEELEAKNGRQAELVADKTNEIRKLKASLSAQKGLVTTHKNRTAKDAETHRLTLSKLRAKLARAEALLPKDTCQLCGEEVPRGLKHSPIARLCATDEDVCSLDYTFEKFLERLVPEAMAAAVALYVHIVTAVLTNITFDYRRETFEVIDPRQLMDWQSRIKDPRHSLLQVLEKKALNSACGVSSLVCAALTAEYTGSGDGDDIALLEIHRRFVNIHMYRPQDQDVRKLDNDHMKCFWEWVVPGRADHPPDDGDRPFSIALATNMKPVDGIDDFILGRLNSGGHGHFLSVAPFGPLHEGWFSAEGRASGTAEAFVLASGNYRNEDDGGYTVRTSGNHIESVMNPTNLEDFGFDAYNKSQLSFAYSRFKSLLVDAVDTLVKARRGSYIELQECQRPDCKHLIDLKDHDVPFAAAADGVRHPWCTDAELSATADAQLVDDGSQKRSAAAEDGARKRVCIDFSKTE